MTPKEIHTLFVEALKIFEPNSGHPTDANLQRIRKAIAPILLSIPCDENGGKDNLVGLIMSNTKYTALYGQSFILFKSLAAYNASIDIDANTAERVRVEATHKAYISDHNIYMVA